MTIAYIDESGNLADGEPFFVVAIVPINDYRLPGRIIKRVRRILGRTKGKISEELKFSKSSTRIKEYFIRRLENEKLYCFVFVVDKVGRRIKDTPENYGSVLRWVLNEGFSILGWDKVVIDRKFSKVRDQNTLTEFLQNNNLDIKRVDFTDSIKEDGIKLADFVAGFYSNFYNRSRRLPKPLEKIVVEERISWNLIKMQKAVVPKGSVAPK